MTQVLRNRQYNTKDKDLGIHFLMHQRAAKASFRTSSKKNSPLNAATGLLNTDRWQIVDTVTGVFWVQT